MSSETLPRPAGIGAFGRFVPTIPHLRLLLWILAGGAALAILIMLSLARSHAAVRYTTAPVVVQTLTQSVTASGTVNPQNSISVGTQVSGTIQSILVDYNSKVTKGQVLARLDPSSLQAQLDQANASLAQAQAQAQASGANATGALSSISVASANSAAQKAAVGAAQANVTKAISVLALAQAQETRDASLFAQGYLAQSLLDTDRSTVAQDRADVAAAQAAAIQASAQAQASGASVALSVASAQGQGATAQASQASVQLAQAVVQEDSLNLSHAVITSPVDGTVIARDVSVGQTVAASFSTPTLFTIAQNLTKMQVDINVGEPDIGNVKRGDPVSFSVLAYPTRIFNGTVAQVRINPQTLNNVVTYDVVVDVSNPDGALLPGMTANATVQVASAPNAMVVPLAALGWTPGGKGAAGAGATSPWGKLASGSAVIPSASGAQASVFVLRNGTLVRTPVRVELATSTQAAVVPMQGVTLNVGDAIVVSSTGGAVAAKRAPLTHSPVGGPLRGVHG